MLKAAFFSNLLATARTSAVESTGTAAKAINSLGIELLAKTSKPDQNALLSPYSIQSALAMTYAGADGITRAEMAKALHYPTNDAELHDSFAAVQLALEDLLRRSKAESERLLAALQKSIEMAVQHGFPRSDYENERGSTRDPIILITANRLFGQAGCDFRPAFLELVKTRYGAPFELLDFSHDSKGATQSINSWVESQTQQRIGSGLH